VLQSRSIEVAKKFAVEIHAKSTFSESQGTIITSQEKIGREKVEALIVSGITFDKNQVKFTIINLPDIPGVAAKIFGMLAKIYVNIDMIIQSASIDKKTNISFTVSKQEMKKTLLALNKISSEFKASSVMHDEHVAKISITGIGMSANSGVAAQMFDILYKEGINIETISTSEIKISCIIDKLDMIKAAKALHEGFGLSKKKELGDSHL
jgi:aspartate kinase